MNFDDQILSFLRGLKINARIPSGIEVMNPYQDAYTYGLCEQFYKKYYHDARERTLLLGINPGRFGSGATGISFTDPIRLEINCGIKNRLPRKPELSADFIYRMIEGYGGPDRFFSHYFLSAVSPLGFLREGKNINYYDDRKLEKAITPFITGSLSRLVSMGVSRRNCYCIGEGRNFEFLKGLNHVHSWFDEVIPLAHPRYIMQYKRKLLNRYLEDYLQHLNDAS